ncbi:hypothetical protein Tco_0240815 [Tanacetum coccineum]
MSSECNNITLAIRNAKSEIVCVMCKQCLVTANHDVCVLNYVNNLNSRADNQSATVTILKNQKKYKANAKNLKKLGSKGSLASSMPSKPRTCLRWIPTGRIFSICGKLTASSNTENQSEKFVCDNVSTSNPSKPSSKGFSISTSLLGRWQSAPASGFPNIKCATYRGLGHEIIKNLTFDDGKSFLEPTSNKLLVVGYFDNACPRVNMFVDMDIELVKKSSKKAEGSETRAEGSSKRAGEELEHEVAKKQKIDDDKEKEELKQDFEIVSDDEDDVTINAIPLSVKILIVDYKIYQEGKKSFFQIIRADGKTQMYLTFSKMLKNFDREDLEVLWSIVKARFKKIKHVDYMDTFLLLTLKTMCEHHVEDESVSFFLLVEKVYPLTKNTLHQMFNDVKLQVDYKCEMAFDLLRLVRKQLKEGYVPTSGV